jgi:hypothetical protein
MQMQSREQFDAMNDADFDAWWDAFEAAVAEQASSEAEVAAARAQREQAQKERWAA